MPRYSGIVQSVEQRTVNPYVTGSSPVARAKISKGFTRNPFSFTFVFATYLLPKSGGFIGVKSHYIANLHAYLPLEFLDFCPI